jgi:hypothetical protein
MKQLPNFEDEVKDEDITLDPEVIISPSYFVNLALINAQNCLLKPDLKEGLIRFKLIVEYMESTCRAMRIIDTDYDDKIKAFTNESAYIDEKEAIAKQTKLAFKKLYLMEERFFRKREIKDALKVRAEKTEDVAE